MLVQTNKAKQNDTRGRIALSDVNLHDRNHGQPEMISFP